MITLRPYQIPVKAQALQILHKHGFCYLVMEPRTGKTPTTFSIFEALCAQEVMFITTKGAKPGIKKTIAKTNPDFKVDLKHYDELPKLIKQDFVPTTPYLVVDEGHLEGAFPDPSQRARYTKEVAQRMYDVFGDAVKIVTLSGTPSPEDYVQLYHQFNVMGPKNPFGVMANFMEHFVDIIKVPIGYDQVRKKPITVPEYRAKGREIIECIRPYFISLTQKQAGFKQTVVDEIYTVQMKPSTGVHMYNLALDKSIDINGHSIFCATGTSLKQKLHQLSGGTIKYEYVPAGYKDPVETYALLDDSKVQFIKRQFAGQKIAIYYQFVAEFELLKQHFPNWTNSDDEFNDSQDKVYLGQFQSKREGVDLRTADRLIAYNIDYAALSYWQFRQRHNYDDRETPCPVAWLFSNYGMEDKIYPKVMNKKTYTQQYFDSDLTFFKNNNPTQLSLFS